jgi:hypothetical protein
LLIATKQIFEFRFDLALLFFVSFSFFFEYLSKILAFLLVFSFHILKLQLPIS